MTAEAALPGAPADRSLRPYRAGLLFGMFNAMTWQIALGTPMVLFAERLGASAFAVGLAYSFVLLLTPIQVLATAWLPRFGYKRVMLSGWSLRSVFLLPPIVIAGMAPATGSVALVACFIGAVFFFTLFRAIGNCAYLPWLNGMLPEAIRGRYFASEQMAAGVGGIATLVLSVLSFRLLPLYAALLLQYLFAFLGSWLSALSLRRLPDGPRPAAMPLREVVRDAPRLVVRPGAFRSFLIVGVLGGAAFSAIPPFCAYYLRVVGGFSAAEVVLFTTVQYGGVFAGAMLLRDHLDRIGARPFFLGSLALYAGLAVFWLLALRAGGAGSVALHVVHFLLGIAASAWFNATMKFLPQVVDPERRALGYSVHGAVTAVMSGLAPVLWGLVLKGDPGRPSMDIAAFQAFFVVALVGTVGLALLARRLPEASPEREGAWATGQFGLRPFRTLGALASLVLPDASRTAKRER